jgi:hypothetical protein
LIEVGHWLRLTVRFRHSTGGSMASLM